MSAPPRTRLSLVQPESPRNGGPQLRPQAQGQPGHHKPSRGHFWPPNLLHYGQPSLATMFLLASGRVSIFVKPWMPPTLRASLHSELTSGKETSFSDQLSCSFFLQINFAEGMYPAPGQLLSPPLTATALHCPRTSRAPHGYPVPSLGLSHSQDLAWRPPLLSPPLPPQQAPFRILFISGPNTASGHCSLFLLALGPALPVFL